MYSIIFWSSIVVAVLLAAGVYVFTRRRYLERKKNDIADKLKGV